MGDIAPQVREVAVGLAFIFLALSLICSSVQELVATVLSCGAPSRFDALSKPGRLRVSGDRPSAL